MINAVNMLLIIVYKSICFKAYRTEIMPDIYVMSFHTMKSKSVIE